MFSFLFVLITLSILIFFVPSSQSDVVYKTDEKTSSFVTNPSKEDKAKAAEKLKKKIEAERERVENYQNHREQGKAKLAASLEKQKETTPSGKIPPDPIPMRSNAMNPRKTAKASKPPISDSDED